MPESKQYPISEIFISPQGEGQYAGSQMAFVRLAGCTVGKPFPKEYYKHELQHPVLPIYTEMCTLYDGRTFACDTDYRVKERLTIDQIFDRIRSLEQTPAGTELYTRHVCVTGGEPFIHDLDPFLMGCFARLLQLHVETSGTIPFKKAFPRDSSLINSPNNLWITVSPKYGALPEMMIRAHEIKLLVDEDFKLEKIPEAVIKHPLVYIQPVNYEHEVNPDNLRRVMDLQKTHPQWRVSLQLHKVLSHYIGERVL